ncbi:MAG: MlaD family protein, partial [Thiovulaceae bacterium]|nr:MlaD family protein [Sulfurimonadaceae bacterium]
MRHNKMAVTVGAFILVTSLLFFLGVIYVVSEKGIFEKKYYYTLMAESGEDLAQGMPILFSGFEIGTVINMDLDDDGRVKLQIEIPEHQLRWVKSDSKFILDKPLIGSAKIMVITENLESETL